MPPRRLPDADLLDLSLVALRDAIAAGEVKAENVVRASLGRIEALNPALNAFIAVDSEEALAKARAADRLRARGGKLPPLHGVPIAVKDMFWQAGKPMTGGSEILLDFVPDETATTVQRLEAAGAIVVGRLNMSEFAASPTGTNKHFGFAKNPWDPARIPGGSSSGSGVAVAARMVPAALGSDTGGSIRIPAAICGLVGLKPTQGRLSMHGTMPRAFSLDVVGPMTRQAADALLMFAVLAGHDPNDSASLRAKVPAPRLPPMNPTKHKIVVLDDASVGELAPSVAKCFSDEARALETVGFAVRRASMSNLPELHALADVISKCEAAALHRRWMTERPEAYARLVYDRTLSGLMLPAVRYIEALSLRAKFTARFLAETMGDADAVLLPTVAAETPSIADVEAREKGAEILPLIGQFTRLTRPFNYLGLPAVAYPRAVDGNGIPVSMQLVGRPLQEAKLLAIAGGIERHIGFALPAEGPALLRG
jgi:aspartyl-tRNA(Asn)/glutamyl-tRNA(Gln) amidotransferase subunit A